MRMDFLKTITPKLFRCNVEVCSYLADKHTLADGPPSELRRDVLNTSTPNLVDKPTLANGPPQNENGFLEDNYTENYLDVM